MSYFIRNDELPILSCYLIPNKQAISDFNSSKKINHLILLLVKIGSILCLILRKWRKVVGAMLFMRFRVIHSCLSTWRIDGSMIYLVNVRLLILSIIGIINVFNFKKFVSNLLKRGCPLYFLHYLLFRLN